MGTLRNSVHQRLSINKKVFLLVLNATMDLCLSIADVVFFGKVLQFISQRCLN